MRRQTEGEGNGKKVSKKKAAETMLHELRQLPPLSPVIVTEAAGAGAVVADTATASDPAATAAAVAAAAAKAKAAKRKQPSVKKKARNLIKVEGVEPEEVNPISRLIMVAQAHKAKDPVYELVAEAGTPRRREFVIEVLAVHRKARGMGSTKKKARRQAAESECEWWGLVGAFFKTYFPDRPDLLVLLSNIANNTGNMTAEEALNSYVPSDPDADVVVPRLLPLTPNANDPTTVRPTQLLINLSKRAHFEVRTIVTYAHIV